MSEVVSPPPDTLVPRYLYKYRSLRGVAKAFARDMIVHQRLYFPKPSELNDPFEFQTVLELSASAEQCRRYVQQVIKSQSGDRPRRERRMMEKKFDLSRKPVRTRLFESYRETMEKIGVFSMSAKALDLLMWPHYADNHAGVCVRFDLASFVNSQNVPLFVTYQRERPTVDPVADRGADMVQKAALTKGLPWAYEEEWRILLKGRGAEVVKFPSPLISGVILGARISRNEREEVIKWVEECNRPMEVYQARFHQTEYALEVDLVYEQSTAEANPREELHCRQPARA